MEKIDFLNLNKHCSFLNKKKSYKFLQLLKK